MKIISLVVGLTVGVLLMVGLVSPVVADGQATAGNEITLTNDSNIVLREVQNGDVLKLTRTIDAGGTATNVWCLNDVVITSIGSTTLEWNVGLISDAWYVQITNNSAVSATAYKMNVTDPANGRVDIGGGGSDPATYVSTFTVADGNITFTSRTGTEQTIPYTWGYVVCPKEEGQYYSAETNGSGICKSIQDLILCGAYTSGDLDTMYAYRNGETYSSNAAYTMGVNAPLTPHTGTTDIYDINVAVSVTDGTNTETFTPYRIFLPYEVTGHATSGANYALLGAIPLVAFIALIAFAAFAVRGRMDD